MTVLLKQKNYVRIKDGNTNFKILFHDKCFVKSGYKIVAVRLFLRVW